MPANCLRRVSAPVSKGDRFTSHDASPGLRNATAGSRLMSSPLRERTRGPRPWVFVGLGVRWLFFVNYRVVIFAFGAFLAYRSDSEVLVTAPP